MYKILNTKALGASGRQNELIELALTHKFQGVEVDMLDLVGRHDTLGKEFACQFLQSAKIDVGTFKLPIEFGASNADFSAQCEKLDTMIDLATTLGAKRCYVEIEPSSGLTAFQENFEQHRTRLHDLADRFKEHEIKIGLIIDQSKKPAEDDYKFIRTAEELLTLVKTVSHENVGICLDTWQWGVRGGAMDQLSDMKPESFVEVRMADVSLEADPGAINSADRVMPGDNKDSMSVRIINFLIDAGFEGPIAVSADSVFFGKTNRDNIVGSFSKRLDQLAEKEDLHAVSKEEATAEAEAAEAAAGDDKETKEGEPVAAGEAT